MRKDLHEYFRALGLNPGASAEEIKRAYRQLVQSWHPDHFKAGSLMQTTAEDITKEINEAYEHLYKKQLYKKFLPKAEPRKPAPPPASVPPSHARRAYEQAADPWRENPAPTPPKPPRPRRPAPRWARTAAPVPPAPKTPPSPKKPSVVKIPRWPWMKFILAAGLVVTLVAIWRQSADAGNEAGSLAFHAPPGPRPAAPASRRAVRSAPPLAATAVKAVTSTLTPSVANPAARAEWPPASLARSSGEIPAIAWRPSVFDRLGESGLGLLDTFEVGDSKNRVLIVQGAPDEAGETIYRYGSSVVYFAGGRVTGWSDRRPRLRVQPLPGLDFAALDTFTAGSSRSEVFRVQGAPTQLTARAYYYGSSAVYFENDAVTGWSDGSLALRTRLLPNLPFGNLDEAKSR